MSGIGAIQKHEEMTSDTLLRVVAGGDISSLSAAQKVAYYNARCEAAGLDPRAQPFAFVKLNGKEVLYALKAASDQLAAKHGIRLAIVSQTTEEGIRVVTVKATARDGRETEEIGAVSIKGLQGDALCNALMKCVTKAKRRAVLSLAGLGMLDEEELDTIPSVRTVAPPLPASAPAGDSPPVVPPSEEQESPAEPVASEVIEHATENDPFATAKSVADLTKIMKTIPQDQRAGVMTAYKAASERIHGRA
jgi:hypothetical protein